MPLAGVGILGLYLCGTLCPAIAIATHLAGARHEMTHLFRAQVSLVVLEASVH